MYRLWGYGYVRLTYGKLHVEREASSKSYVEYTDLGGFFWLLGFVF